MKSKIAIALLLLTMVSTILFVSGSTALRDEAPLVIIPTYGKLGKSAGFSSSFQSGLATLTDPSHINGTVTNAATTSPIKDANVTANGVSHLTDDNGHYDLQIAPGNYTVMVTKSGFISQSKNATVAVNQTTTVNFALSPVPVKAVVIINPRALNLRSHGKWITVSIELPKNISAKDINVSSIMLNNEVPVDLKAPMEIANSTLTVKFSRAAVEAIILKELAQNNKFDMVTLTITGKLKNGTTFTGNDTIKTIFNMPTQETKNHGRTA